MLRASEDFFRSKWMWRYLILDEAHRSAALPPHRSIISPSLVQHQEREEPGVGAPAPDPVAGPPPHHWHAHPGPPAQTSSLTVLSTLNYHCAERPARAVDASQLPVPGRLHQE